MSKAMRAFFDSLASKWDEHATDDIQKLRPLFKRLGINQGDKVMDLACGTGVVTGLLHEFSGEDVLGLDLSPKMIELAKAKYADQPFARFEVGDFLQYKGETFDFIVIYNAYPHFTDPEALSSHLAQTLNEGGRFAVVHSLSRAALTRHHEHVDPRLSRTLEEPRLEKAHFENQFKMKIWDEGPDYYLLVGEKLSD